MRLFSNYALLLFMLLLLLVFTSLLSITVGAIDIPLGDVLMALFNPSEHQSSAFIINSIRLPRLILGLLVGGALAVSGAALQGLFRNPLADPGLIGVSSGAALGAVTVIVLGGSYLQQYVLFWGYFALPVSAFIGGAVVTWLIYRIATRYGTTDVSLMLLTGIAMGTIAASLTGLLTFISNDEELRSLTFWSMGSVAGASWQDIRVAIIPITVSMLLLPFYAKALNATLMGEAVAFQIGYNTKHLKKMIIVLVALAVGSAVAMSGFIGFIGLVAPHLMRLLVGPDNRYVMPGSALIGAMLMLVADMFARVVVEPAELPVGIPMAVVGGSFFLWLLFKQRYKSQLYF